MIEHSFTHLKTLSEPVLTSISIQLGTEINQFPETNTAKNELSKYIMVPASNTTYTKINDL